MNVTTAAIGRNSENLQMQKLGQPAKRVAVRAARMDFRDIVSYLGFPDGGVDPASLERSTHSSTIVNINLYHVLRPKRRQLVQALLPLIGCLAAGRGVTKTLASEADARLGVDLDHPFATLRLRSESGGSALPFSAGFAFRKGDIPRRSFPIASGRAVKAFQAAIQNRWPDGSAKFAVLSGLVDLQRAVEETVSLRAGDAPTPDAVLDSGELVRGGTVASVLLDGVGSVTWQGLDWKKPLLQFVSGPQMSSWVYRKPMGSDRHVVAWVEVRLYRGGAVEFLPWIENGYLLQPGPGERKGIATFVVGGQVRFSGDIDLRNHQRAVLAEGDVLSHWAGSDPLVTFRHDVRYLQETGLFPQYSGITAPGASLFGRLTTRYVPLAVADFPKGMGAGGYDKSIGPLPEWDVAYLTSDGDPRAWRAVQVNGYAAGRYGFHFRDDRTFRAPRLSEHPHLVLGTGSGIVSVGASTAGETTPAASGGEPPGFHSSHMPSIGYMAYLVTGRWYFVDEMQLLAAAMLLKQSDAPRRFTEGIIQSSAGSNTTRGAAWALRALASAAALTPDQDAVLKRELVGVVQNNVDWYHGRYVAKPSNPLGLAQPYSDYTPGDGKVDSASWMEDFLTWSFGNIQALEICDATHQERLKGFLAWKYRSIVGRLGPNEPGHWSYRQAAAYTIPYAPSESADWIGGNGPWYKDWGEAFLAAKLEYEPGTSLLGAYIDGTGLATSYWGNLQPAIAYAVEQNAAGALEAYNRMTAAPNWTRAATFFDTDTPVWSVRPRNVARAVRGPRQPA
jgi:hypothetical protein